MQLIIPILTLIVFSLIAQAITPAGLAPEDLRFPRSERACQATDEIQKLFELRAKNLLGPTDKAAIQAVVKDQNQSLQERALKARALFLEVQLRGLPSSVLNNIVNLPVRISNSAIAMPSQSFDRLDIELPEGVDHAFLVAALEAHEREHNIIQRLLEEKGLWVGDTTVPMDRPIHFDSEWAFDSDLLAAFEKEAIAVEWQWWTVTLQPDILESLRDQLSRLQRPKGSDALGLKENSYLAFQGIPSNLGKGLDEFLAAEIPRRHYTIEQFERLMPSRLLMWQYSGLAIPKRITDHQQKLCRHILGIDLPDLGDLRRNPFDP